MGLRKSEHIARILVDPRHSNVVYVAAEGPLWSSGGERGLYKSTDGGATWTLSLEINKDTGVTSAEFDPSNPDILYAAAYQRRRTVAAFMGGGPESGIYKTTDAGKTWRKLTVGLPDGRHGQDRPGRLADRPARRLRHGRGLARRARLLPIDRPRRELGEAQQLHQRRHRPALLPGDLRRPEPLRPGLPDGPGPARHRRRRDDVAAGGREEQARRQPRDGVRQGRPRLHPERQRRRRLREPRRRRRPGASSRTCRSRSSTRSRSTTTRRSTTCTAARRTTAPSRGRRARSTRTASATRTGSSPSAPTATTPPSTRPTPTRLPRVAGRQPAALRPQEPGDGLHQPAARPRRAAAPLQLGLAGHRQPALAHADLLRRPVRVAQRQPRRLLDEGQPRPHAEHLPPRAADHGPRPGAPTRCGTTARCRCSRPSRRSANRRWSKA